MTYVMIIFYPKFVSVMFQRLTFIKSSWYLIIKLIRLYFTSDTLDIIWYSHHDCITSRFIESTWPFSKVMFEIRYGPIHFFCVKFSLQFEEVVTTIPFRKVFVASYSRVQSFKPTIVPSLIRWVRAVLSAGWSLPVWSRLMHPLRSFCRGQGSISSCRSS